MHYKKVPVAFYDFTKWPLTFDFVQFIALAKRHFSAKGIDKFHVILYRPQFRCTSSYELLVREAGTEEIRFQHIIIAALTLCDCIAGFTIQHNTVFDRNLNVDFPLDFPAIRAGQPLLPYISEPWHFRNFYVGETSSPIIFNHYVPYERRATSPYITLSLRTSSQKSERSVRLGTWAEIAKRLKKNGFRVVVIPDHDDYFSSRDAWDQAYAWDIDQRASWNLSARLQLYNGAFTNICPTAGWASLLIYSSNSFLSFPKDSRSFESSDTFFNIYGPKLGEQPYWFSENQHWYWEEFYNIESNVDYFYVIINSFLHRIVENKK